eukprot:TRINITY_DN148_c1_g1_i1.p1 TRINITY_DN148_c1_g1~~TRINITY_DN148_c1_g1_i1.p1  ORF type:complete len:365 (-),score=102.22 TRINITY_DN148_c1_g1_i1:219-1313(-)
MKLSFVPFLLIAFVVAAAAKPTLRFKPNGTFRILQLTDLHFGEDVAKDANTTQLIVSLLKWEQPDFVMMTGDMVSGWYGGGKPFWMETYWPKIVAPMIEAKIPWAFAAGNHDPEANLKRAQVAALDAAYDLSLTAPSTGLHGATNYLLSVWPASSTVVPSTHIWVFDSGDYTCMGVKGYDCIRPDQIEWYRTLSAEMKVKYLKTVPALSFFHIPLPEYMYMWNHINVSWPSSPSGYENPACGSLNSGLYAAFKEAGDVKFVSVGHDHDDDFVGDYHGIQLAYGRKVGWGCYGPVNLHGARVIQLKENPFTISTWIRQEDGSVIDKPPVHAPEADHQYNVCGDSDGLSGGKKVFTPWMNDKKEKK